MLPPSQETERLLQKGTFAQQCRDPGSHVYFRNLQYRPLPAATRIAVKADDTYRKIIELGVKNYPLVDYHVHFHGTLGLATAMEQSRRNGVFFGLAAHCGRESCAVRADSSALAFLESVSGQQAFAGMQVEGEDWMRYFTRATCARFDYLCSDAMIWTSGTDPKLWRRIYLDEGLGAVPDPQAFVEDFATRIVRTIASQPIDFYANPTYLPPSLEPRRAELWTESRQNRVIQASVRHGVAIELSDRHKLSNEQFVKRAEAAGCKFVLGAGNGTDQDLLRSSHGLEWIGKCELSWTDLALLGERGRRAVDRRAHLFPA